MVKKSERKFLRKQVAQLMTRPGERLPETAARRAAVVPATFECGVNKRSRPLAPPGGSSKLKERKIDAIVKSKVEQIWLWRAAFQIAAFANPRRPHSLRERLRRNADDRSGAHGPGKRSSEG